MIIPKRFGNLYSPHIAYLAEKAGNSKALEMLNNEAGFDNIYKELNLSPAIWESYSNKCNELLAGTDYAATAKFIREMRIFLTKIIIDWDNYDNTME